MKKAHYTDLHERSKKASKTLFVSATPAKYEAAHSQQVVEQIIRPTGLLDPITYVYPKSGDYQTLIDSIDILWKQKPETKKLFEKE
jgi:excinuclease ABC subunit B